MGSQERQGCGWLKAVSLSELPLPPWLRTPGSDKYFTVPLFNRQPFVNAPVSERFLYKPADDRIITSPPVAHEGTFNSSPILGKSNPFSTAPRDVGGGGGHVKLPRLEVQYTKLLRHQPPLHPTSPTFSVQLSNRPLRYFDEITRFPLAPAARLSTRFSVSVLFYSGVNWDAKPARSEVYKGTAPTPAPHPTLSHIFCLNSHRATHHHTAARI
ncbi:hypothetical protein J6590_043795 [Homalodisca vitripennis]|nr:hypothetical protein J6590_043795 [Homalodisca vitripennis]